MSRDSFDKLHIGIFKEQITAQLRPVVQIKFPYHIAPESVVVSNVASGTTTQADSMAIVSSGAATSSSSQLLSKEVAVYQPGQGVACRFSAIFTTGVAGNTQIIGMGDDTDGLFVGYNGTEFGILHRQNGTDTWTTGNNLNGELFQRGFTGDGPLDPTKGNIFQIQYQWLGFGNILFTVFDSIAEDYKVLHKIEYPNKNIVPSMYNPSLPICVMSENTTNDTAMIIKTASAGAYIEGHLTTSYDRHAKGNAKVVTTEVNILTIRNRATFQSKTNRGVVLPDLISIAADGTKNVIFNVYKNTTLGGTPSYTDIETLHSLVEFDTAGTTVTGGDLLFSFRISKTGDSIINLNKMDIKLQVSDLLTITASSANSAIADVSFAWKELL